MFCRRCGHPVAEGTQFCLACGEPVASGRKPETANIPGAFGPPEAPPASGAPRKKHTKRTLLIVAACVLAVCGALTPVVINVVLSGRYEQAFALMDSGAAEEAKAAFVELGSFKDAQDQAQECQNMLDYESATKLMKAGSYDKAKQAFDKLGSFEDAQEQTQECQNVLDYDRAVALKDSGEFGQARDIFAALPGYEDADDQAQECQNQMDYDNAMGLMDAGSYQEAKDIFEALGTYSDAMLLSARCQNNIDYNTADALFNEGSYYEAYQIFWNMSSFKDNYDRAFACIQSNPDNGELYRNDDYAKKSCAVNIKLGDKGMSMYMKFYTADDVLVSTVFVKAGAKTKVKLPAGEYRVKTAYGVDWFGEKDMFGDEGYYQELVFDSDNGLYKLSTRYVYTLEFLQDKEGNIVGQGVGSEGF